MRGSPSRSRAEGHRSATLLDEHHAKADYAGELASAVALLSRPSRKMRCAFGSAAVPWAQERTRTSRHRRPKQGMALAH